MTSGKSGSTALSARSATALTPAPGQLAAQWEDALAWGVTQWVRGFPASYPDSTSQTEQKADWRELLREIGVGVAAYSTTPWVDVDLFKRTVRHIAWNWQGVRNDGRGSEYRPPPAHFLAQLKEQRAERVREEQRKQAPAPEDALAAGAAALDDATGPPARGRTMPFGAETFVDALDDFDWYFCVGVIRQRKRAAKLLAHRQRGHMGFLALAVPDGDPDLAPTEAEIRADVKAITQAKKHHKMVERMLACGMNRAVSKLGLDSAHATYSADKRANTQPIPPDARMGAVVENRKPAAASAVAAPAASKPAVVRKPIPTKPVPAAAAAAPAVTLDTAQPSDAPVEDFRTMAERELAK